MKRISDIIKKATLSPAQVSSLQITAAWPQVIKAICPAYESETRAHKFVDHVLTITTITSEHLMILQMKKIQLLEKYHYYFGENIVTDIKFRLGRL
jgi:predicted nucleic acid-binding Zn ribbon protein